MHGAEAYFSKRHLLDADQPQLLESLQPCVLFFAEMFAFVVFWELTRRNTGCFYPRAVASCCYGNLRKGGGSAIGYNLLQPLPETQLLCPDQTAVFGVLIPADAASRDRDMEPLPTTQCIAVPSGFSPLRLTPLASCCTRTYRLVDTPRSSRKDKRTSEPARLAFAHFPLLKHPSSPM